MRNYLSQIVSRAAGTTEAATIKPNRQSWPVKKNAENRLNPFEEGGDFTEPATLTSSIESTTSPFKKTMPFKKEQYPKNDFPAINKNDRAMENQMPQNPIEYFLYDMKILHHFRQRRISH